MSGRRHHWDPRCDPPTGLVRPVRMDPAGVIGPSRSEAERAGRRGSEWRRVWHGWFVPVYVDPDTPEQRILESSVLLPDAGAVTGWGALRMQRATFFDGRSPRGPLPVPLVTDQGRRRRDGIVWCQDRLDPGEVVVRSGVPVVRTDRATFDAMRTAEDVRAAVIVLDMAAAAELTSVGRMTRYIDGRPGWDGVVQTRTALTLADERSRSPAETALRMVWRLDAGLPRPLVNQEVFTRSGRLLGVADLLDVEAGLVVEFDGADHAGAARRSSDARREGGLRDHELEVERVTGFDLHHVDALVGRLHAARRRARWTPPDTRLWTTVGPGTDVAESLDARLEQRDLLRACEEEWLGRAARGAGALLPESAGHAAVRRKRA